MFLGKRFFFFAKLCAIALYFLFAAVDGENEHSFYKPEKSITSYKRNKIINNYFYLDSHRLPLDKLLHHFGDHKHHKNLAKNKHLTHENIYHRNRKDKYGTERLYKPIPSYPESYSLDYLLNYANHDPHAPYNIKNLPFVDHTRNVKVRNENEFPPFVPRRQTLHHGEINSDLINYLNEMTDKTKVLRKSPYDSEDSDMSSSESEERPVVKKKKKKAVRYDDDDDNNSDERSADSAEEDDTSEEVYEKKKKPSSKTAPEDLDGNEHYMQGPGRVIEKDDLRKNMQYFLPKRFFWKSDDIKDLGYYWFEGHH